MSAHDAITHWHALLDADPALAQESEAALTAQLERRGLVFGGRPLATVLRPRLVGPQQHDRIMAVSDAILPAMARSLEAALADPVVRADFRLAEWEERWVGAALRYASSPTSRLDFFLDDATGGAALTENNAETPAGAAYNDALVMAFADLPVTREVARRWRLQPVLTRHGVVRGLLGAWHAWRGTRELPHVGIVDWKEVPTYSEFVLWRDHLLSLGIPCDIVDPRDAEYDGTHLRFGGTKVTLLYKRVLLHELVARGGPDHPIFRAVRDRAVCIVNPPQCKLLHKKASLAVLTDERHAALFTAEQHAAIRACIPWTRVVEARTTTIDGRTVDLLDFVTAHRERFVLKPNDDYGGAGIVLGWTVDAPTWAAALGTALASPYIVQERVHIPSQGYPSLVDGRSVVVDRMYDTAPFVTDGATTDGFMTRLSTAALLNVTAGGGSTVPAFVVTPR